MQLFYDCETSGLPDFKAPSEAEHQPYILQLSAILRDDDGTEVRTFDRYIKPFEGFKVDPKTTELTGITQEIIDTKGEDPETVIWDFLELVELAEYNVVGHNETFDARMVRIMLHKLQADESVLQKWKELRQPYCTMVTCTDILKLPPTDRMKAAGFHKFKSPKLAECYRYYFGTDFDGAHNSLNDVRATIAVYICVTNNAQPHAA